jgi:glycerophosphoryl diester phosphodiesterase
MSFIRLTVWIAFLFTLFRCERVEYFPDKPVAFERTRIIAHQGGGVFDAGNTFEACQYGLEIAEGIEVDVQRSSDNVLWLSHSANIVACGVVKETCFASLSNNAIIAIDSCLGNDVNYTQLEPIFAYMNDHHPDKYISLDVKAWHPCDLSNANVIRQMNQMAKVIIDLTAKYHRQGHVMVESEVGDFLYYVKSHSDGIETYLVSLGDFELGISRALEGGFSGVSFHFKFEEPVTKELVDLMHRKGLKIQLWKVAPEDMEEARSVTPDFIQTDYF